MVLNTNHAIFLIEVLGVLAIPGPTNSLLFVSGVTRGLRLSLPLVLATVVAYSLSISLLLFALKPASQVHAAVGPLLRVLCSLYLVHLAVWLWRAGAQEVQDSHPITIRRVFLTTLMNPKTLIFALGIFPAAGAGANELLTSLTWFAAVCTAVACGWIAGGAFLHSTGAHKTHLNWLYRGEAFLLAGFAIVILVSAYYSS